MTTAKATSERPSQVGALTVRVAKPKVDKSKRAASVRASSRVSTKTSVDFVKAVRGR